MELSEIKKYIEKLKRLKAESMKLQESTKQSQTVKEYVLNSPATC